MRACFSSSYVLFDPGYVVDLLSSTKHSLLTLTNNKQLTQKDRKTLLPIRNPLRKQLMYSNMNPAILLKAFFTQPIIAITLAGVVTVIQNAFTRIANV